MPLRRCQIVVASRVLGPLLLLLWVIRGPLGDATRTAHHLVCMNHMKQLGICFVMYDDDWNSPPPDQWPSAWSSIIATYAAGPLSQLRCSGRGAADDGYLFLPEGVGEPELPMLLERFYNHLDESSSPGILFEILDRPASVRVMYGDGHVQELEPKEAIQLEGELRRAGLTPLASDGAPAFPTDRVPGALTWRIRLVPKAAHATALVAGIVLTGIGLFVSKRPRQREAPAA